eukprot:7333644-Ditylum_brightwellii.AAC.1
MRDVLPSSCAQLPISGMTKSCPYSGPSHVLTPEVLPCPVPTVFPVVFRGTSLYVCTPSHDHENVDIPCDEVTLK